jgi:hypothetical protein
MKTFFKNISLYWKCQLVGWLVFTFVAYIFNALVYGDYIAWMPFAISIFIFGLPTSHLMKLFISKYRIMRKKFASQVIYLSLVSLFFSLTGTLAWMMIMIKAGFWKFDRVKYPQWGDAFKHGYFFNLFPVLLTFSGWVLIYFLFYYVKGVRKEERLKTHYKLQLLELEAKALRAQMNPHFIFNCLNSIKSLIQQNEKEKSVTYLTTFSKLIRNLFNSADKKEITLYDEIETCKLYLQLEAMRFDARFSYIVNVDANIDLKSVQVPALIVQPFIENAIWHGIVPRNNGGHLELNVLRNDGVIEIVIDDNGIGREASLLNKPASGPAHLSKGVNLTQSRLELNNLLMQWQAKLETIDKKDEKGIATGTKIIISIKEEI